MDWVASARCAVVSTGWATDPLAHTCEPFSHSCPLARRPVPGWYLCVFHAYSVIPLRLSSCDTHSIRIDECHAKSPLAACPVWGRFGSSHAQPLPFLIIA